MFFSQKETKQDDKSHIQNLILQKENELEVLKNRLGELEGSLESPKVNIGLNPERAILMAWLNNLNASIEVIDKDGQFIFVNDFFCKRIGYPKEKLTKMNVADIDPTIKNKQGWGDFFKIISKTGSMVLSGVHMREDGSTYPVEINARYVMIDKEEFVLAVTVDITERNEKEKILVRTQALFNEIMNNSDEAIFLVDSELDIIVDCNQKAQSLLGFEDKDSLIGLRGNTFQKTPFTEQEREDIICELRTKGHWESEIICKNQTGHTFWCSFSSTLLKIANETPYFLVRLIDIENKKIAEQNLIQSEKRFKDLVYYNQTLICTHDLEGKILTINPACLISLDYEEESELIGHNLKMLFDERNISGYQEYLRQINENGVSQGIMQVVNKHGKKMYWVYRNYKVEELGADPYVVGSAQDITDRVMIEKELKKANVIAEQSLKARELFLANISHEVRTPLHGIMGVANLLRRTSVSPQQDNYLKIIRHSSESLLVIMNDILDIAKMESGKFELEHIPFELYDTIKNSVQHLSLKAAEKGLDFIIRLPNKAIPHLLGDPYRLAQIIVNLTNNAIKFTEFGKIELNVEILHDINNKLTVEVKIIDTGIGIAEDKIETIFDEFTQADASHTRLYGGTGLGLSICKKLVKLQNGSIYANSNQGDGSEFGFILHFEKTQIGFRVEEEISEINYEQFKGLKVLLAEDNAVNQLIAKTLLEMKGAKVDAADSGSGAIELFKQNQYDLILMDIQMPDMDGDLVANVIRSLPNNLDYEIPIIALTANAMKGDHDRYILAGMNSYLSKPYTELELFQKIATTLNMSLNKKTKDINFSEEKMDISELEMIKPYDLSELVEMFGDKAMVAILMKTFVDTMPSEIDLLKKHLANKDLLGIKNSLHKLKPSLIQMQNHQLTNYLEVLKEKLFSENILEIQPVLEKVLDITEAIVEAMKTDPDLLLIS